MKLVHVSDIHLDHLRSEQELVAFAAKIVATNSAALVISGDISQAKTVVYHLSVLERELQRPIYYVAGNHDYYGSSIADVRKQFNELTNVSHHLRYLSEVPCISLSKDTAIVGHDGWYDVRYGDHKQSSFLMTDWYAIQEFSAFSGGQRYMARQQVMNMHGVIDQARKLASEGAQHIHDGIKQAVVRKHSEVVIVTHFPPFAQACVYRGQPTGAGHLPFYSSMVVGDVLRDAANAFPNVKFTVLCGHTHGKTTYQYAPNMICHTAGADYGTPSVNMTIDIQ